MQAQVAGRDGVQHDQKDTFGDPGRAAQGRVPLASA